VTEKLYDRSRYRYRPYLPHLQPVIEKLSPVIARLGYSIEPLDAPHTVPAHERVAAQ
jgi:hypothetical protein